MIIKVPVGNICLFSNTPKKFDQRYFEFRKVILFHFIFLLLRKSLLILTCMQCGQQWTPNKPWIPKILPNCKSQNWMKK